MQTVPAISIMAIVSGAGKWAFPGPFGPLQNKEIIQLGEGERRKERASLSTRNNFSMDQYRLLKTLLYLENLERCFQCSYFLVFIFGDMHFTMSRQARRAEAKRAKLRFINNRGWEDSGGFVCVCVFWQFWAWATELWRFLFVFFIYLLYQTRSLGKAALKVTHTALLNTNTSLST